MKRESFVESTTLNNIMLKFLRCQTLVKFSRVGKPSENKFLTLTGKMNENKINSFSIIKVHSFFE